MEIAFAVRVPYQVAAVVVVAVVVAEARSIGSDVLVAVGLDAADQALYQEQENLKLRDSVTEEQLRQLW